MYCVYILRLSSNNYYIGYTKNINQRLIEHNKGKVTSTKKYLPVKLVFHAIFDSKRKAIDFEKYLKTPSGYAFRNKRLIS